MKNIIFNKKNISITFIFIAFLILCINYTTNFFNIVNSNWFETWQNDSDSLVIGRAYLIQNFGILKDYFLLPKSEQYTQGFFDVNGAYESYTSQFGLAGNITALLLNLPHGITLCHILISVLFCCVLFYIIKWIKEEIGIVAAIGAFLTALLSKWLIVSVRDIYWIVFIFLLPFATSLYFLKNESEKGKSNILLWTVINFFIILFKACSGFEGITVILINSVLPIFYYAYKDKWSLKRTLKVLITISISGLSAFLSGILIHLIQMYYYFNHNINEALTLLNNDIARRIGGLEYIGELPDYYYGFIHCNKFQVLKMYLINGDTIIFNFRMLSILIIYILSIVLLFIINKSKTDKIKPYIFITTISLLSPISWYVLAAPHSIVHTHINYIYWSMPALILIGAFLFYVLEKLFTFFIKLVFREHTYNN